MTSKNGSRGNIPAQAALGDEGNSKEEIDELADQLNEDAGTLERIDFPGW